MKNDHYQRKYSHLLWYFDIHFQRKTYKYIFLLFLLLFLSYSSLSYATSFAFRNFSDAGTTGMLVFNGTASSISGSVLEVLNTISASPGPKGSVFYYQPVTLNANKAFSTSFAFQTPINSPTGSGDGFTFTIHNHSVGTAALGNGGGGLGCCGTDTADPVHDPGGVGILNSLSIEFDFFDNSVFGDFDLPVDHIGVHKNGSASSSFYQVKCSNDATPGWPPADAAMTCNSVSGFDMKQNGVWYVWIDYTGTQLETRVSQTDVRPVTANFIYVVNLNTVLNNPSPSQAYVGFTSGNGYGQYTQTQILRWRFVDSYWPLDTTKLPTFAVTMDNSVYDPAATNKKMIPNEDVVHTAVVTNTGGKPFANSVTTVFDIPSQLSLKVGSVTFTDAVGGGATSLTCCGGAGNLDYSNTAGPGYSWGYTPVGTYDPNVRAVKVTPTGIMNAGHLATTGFQLTYQTQIQ